MARCEPRQFHSANVNRGNFNSANVNRGNFNSANVNRGNFNSANVNAAATATSTSTGTSTSAVAATEALITGEVGAASPPASRRVPSSAVPLQHGLSGPGIPSRTRLVHTQITRIADFERLRRDGFFDWLTAHLREDCLEAALPGHSSRKFDSALRTNMRLEVTPLRGARRRRFIFCLLRCVSRV